MLIVPRRHFTNYFDCTPEERHALGDLVEEAKRHLDDAHAADGYNLGINIGQAAGQTAMHLHFHLIPRYKGDMGDPTGGVRGVIPHKQEY